MKKVAVIMVVAGFLLSVTAMANSNVALNKPVTLDGTFFSGGWGTANYTGTAASLVDGVFLPEQHEWDQDSVWWDSYSYPSNNITVNLQGTFSIDRFVVQADDNDTYLLQYLNAGTWKTAWLIPPPGPWGLITSSIDLSTPIITSELRFTAVDGDGLNAVSEIQAFGTSIPDTGSSLALLSGTIAMMGILVRKFRT